MMNRILKYRRGRAIDRVIKRGRQLDRLRASRQGHYESFEHNETDIAFLDAEITRLERANSRDLDFIRTTA